MRTVVTLTILLISSINCFSNYWHINSTDSTKADFSTLQEAINNYQVKHGDTLYVAKSTMFESTVLNKMLTVIGPGYELCDTTDGASLSLTSILWGLNILSKGNGSRICGLTITGDLALQQVDNITIKNCKIKNINSYHKEANKNMRFESCYIHGSLNANISESYFTKNIFVLPENMTINIGRNCMLNKNIIIGKAEKPLLSTTNSSVTNNTIINTAVCKEDAIDFGYNYKNLNIGKNGNAENQVYNNIFSAVPGIPTHNDQLNTYITPEIEGKYRSKKKKSGREQELFDALNSLYSILQLPRNF